MASLTFNPQKVFQPAYNMEVEDIMRMRTFFNPAYDFFVDWGGRGAGKTKDKIRSVVLEAAIRPVRVLVTRELQNSIEESVKAEIEACIVEEGLTHFFKITDKKIEAINGSRFIFKGLKNNINNLKSIADVDIVLIEEAENVSELSWTKLLPSIRPISGRAIVIVIFNPNNELDSTYQRWVLNPPPKTLQTSVQYYDNKYFPKFLDDLRLHDKKTMPKKLYDNTWLGVPKGSDGDIIIDLDWMKACRFAHQHPEWEKVGRKVVGYDPAGQGRDANASVFADGNVIHTPDEWVKSPDLRVATRRAIDVVRMHNADDFVYDECGGFGDGVSVFASDNIGGNDYLHPQTPKQIADGEEFHPPNISIHTGYKPGVKYRYPRINLNIVPFNAGDSIVVPEGEIIKDTKKSPQEIYCNQKAHAHGVFAQKCYNTYRFIVLGERGISFDDMVSFDIEDDDVWHKLSREMTTAVWVKSENNSKKKVEPKKDMAKRTGQQSPNMNDAVIMCYAPREMLNVAGGFDW